MKIITNDLYCGIERWDDPGDYPNNCAGYPLPSYSYCEYSGEFVFEAENDAELKELSEIEDNDDWVYEWVKNECSIDSYCNISCKCVVEGNRCTVTITNAEYEDPGYDGPDRCEDDY